MKTLGILGATGLGTTGLVTANGNGNGDRRQLEENPSFVAYSVFVGTDNVFPGFYVNRQKEEEEDHTPIHFPQLLGVRGDGPFNFDTTVIEITPNEKVLHYVLRFVQGSLFVNKPKPYLLRETEDSLYKSHAAVNLEIPELPEDVQNPLPLPPGKYRATIRDKLHLYEETSYFDWAITRADFFSRGNGKMESVLSLLYFVWDEDGPMNDDDEDKVDRGTLGDGPESEDPNPTVLPQVTIDPALELVNAGVSNPGGK